MNFRDTPSGILIVDKPSGPTSHDVVAQARRVFRLRSLGHAGTLDPMARGVLILLLGEATKLSGYLTDADKTYLATVQFGRATDTLDALGTTTETVSFSPETLGDGRLQRAIERETARAEQIPPAYSAIHVGGIRSHRLSRQGVAVSLPPRSVRVLGAELRGVGPDWATIELTVSKGYYVRSFARDLGQSLGTPAHLSALTRTRSGRFCIEEAVAWPPTGIPDLLAVSEAVQRSMPTSVLTAEGAELALCGKRLAPEHFAKVSGDDGTSAWLTTQGQLIALGRPEGAEFRVVRGFNLTGLAQNDPVAGPGDSR